jgi:DNA-binding MarR family transcriptional regulator
LNLCSKGHIFIWGLNNYKMDKKKQTKGIWIPEEIKVDKKLDWTNKALLSEIYSLCKLPNGCIASDNHFGKLLGIKRPSVNKRVNKLEELGYITSKNHFEGKQCIGRTITKGSSVKKHIVVPEVLDSSSNNDKLVVPEVKVGSSVENTINSFTTSDLTIQETIQYTREVENSKTCNSHFLKNRYEELMNELTEKSSLGKSIFYYINPEKLNLLKYMIDGKEYKIVYPIISEAIDISRKFN